MAQDNHTRLTVLVPEDERDEAKRNTKHGEISEKIRELIHHLAHEDEFEVSREGVTSREEQVKELVESGEYPSDWMSRRDDAFLRDNYLCQNCGDRGGPDGTKDLVAHHIVPAEDGGNHYLSNLATLCTECHEKVHSPKRL